MPGADGNDPIPAGLTYSPDGKQILATFNGSNTLAVLDAESGAVIRQIPVGNAPRDVVVEDGHAFVANQGGRPAQPGDKTNDSYGTKIVTNDENGSPSTGSVSEVDLATGTVVGSYDTGLAPRRCWSTATTSLLPTPTPTPFRSSTQRPARSGKPSTSTPAPAHRPAAPRTR